MSSPAYSDSPGSPTRYLGQTYRFAPVYIRDRDPRSGTDSTPFTSPDIHPKENQGYYPVGSFWVNKTLDKLWSCVSFGLDANGKTCARWILIAIAGIAIISVNVDAFTPPGTDPVTPDALGVMTITGGQVAAGTIGANVIRTDSLAVNTFTIEIQRSTTSALADSTLNGVSHFNATQFTVDADGFVSLVGGGTMIDSINVDASTPPGTDPVVADGTGQITITGGQVATGTIGANVIRTDSLAVNTFTIEIQRSTSAAASDSTLNGVSHFNSAQFTVDAAGFVSTSGTGVLNTLTGNTGGPISPVAGNINTVGTGSITIAGAGNTLTTQLTGLTLNAIQVGAGTPTLTQLGPVNRAVLTTTAAGVPTLTALAVDGQLIIGSTAGAPAAATLTAGTGITITNGSNAITITATGAGFTWTDVTTATQTLAVFNGYLTDRGAGVTYTLPATAAIGDEIRIVGKLGLTTIAQNAGQQILMSSASSTVGVTGTVVGTNVGDCIDLICIVSGASTVWRAANFVGNWTVT